MGNHIVCDGRGAGGDHCCYINGEVCEFLDMSGSRPLCSVWDKMGTGRWQKSLIGQWFARKHPGFTCQDWPQNIPEVMNRPNVGRALCCWSEK